MRIEDIDIKEECIRVLGKGDKERIVFLGARAIEFLEQYLGDRKSGPVFLSVRAPYQGLKKNALENIVRNGDCQIGYEACEKLPTLSDEEAMVLDRRMKRREYGIEE